MPKSVVNMQTSTPNQKQAGAIPSVNSYAYSNVAVSNSATITPSITISKTDGNAFLLDYSVGLVASTTTGVITGATIPATTKEIVLSSTIPVGGTAIGTAKGTIAVHVFATAIDAAPLFNAYVVKGEDFIVGQTFTFTEAALKTLGLLPLTTTWAGGVLTLTIGDQVYPLPNDTATTPPSQITTVTLPNGAYGIRLPDTHQIIIDSVTATGEMSDISNTGTTTVSWSAFDTNTNGSRQFQIRRSNFAGPHAAPTGRFLRGGRIYLRIVSGCDEGSA